MRVRRIEVAGFMSHAAYRLELPEKGLVIITGANGTGKSGLIEAVAWSVWGETLRGTPPHTTGVACKATVEADRFTSHRERNRSGKASLSWSFFADEPGEEYENLQKAQAALEAVAGTFDVWRHSHVFSAADAALFTTAPDGERKRLLETILGLGRFDRASSRCRERLRDATRALEVTEAKHQRLRDALAAEERRKAEADEALVLAAPGGLDEDALRKRGQELTGLIQKAQAEVAAAQQKVREASAGVGLAEEERVRKLMVEVGVAGQALDALDRQFRALEDRVCHACRRPFEEGEEGRAHKARERERLEKEKVGAKKRHAEASAKVDEAKQTLIDVRKAAEAARAGLEEELEELHGEVDAIKDKRVKIAAKLSAAQAQRTQRERFEKIATESAAAVEKLRADCAAVESKRKEEEKLISVLQAADQVLGLRGVRAHILEDALAAIEASGNLQLARLAPEEDLKLIVRGSREKKNEKGTIDKISLDIEGLEGNYGGGYGYKACSGGQRRRLDLAILLALAEVALAVSGSAGGTIFMDECLDAIDSEGVEAVAYLVREMAEQQCIVLVTHNSDLVSRAWPRATRVHLERPEGTEKGAIAPAVAVM